LGLLGAQAGCVSLLGAGLQADAVGFAARLLDVGIELARAGRVGGDLGALPWTSHVNNRWLGTLHANTTFSTGQTYVLEGSIQDVEGTVSAGDFVWRPTGNRHDAWSPDGALVLAFFLKPNKFLEGPLAGKLLE